MANQGRLIETLIRRMQRCLEDQGVQAEPEISEHDGILAVVGVHGTEVRVVVHITDRQVAPAGSGMIPAEIARLRRSTLAMQPSLAERSAAGLAGVPTAPLLVQQRAAAPKKEISATTMKDFQDQVDALPEKPIGDGKCQLIRQRKGEIWVALCDGPCDEGQICRLTTGVRHGTIFSRCDCSGPKVS